MQFVESKRDSNAAVTVDSEPASFSNADVNDFAEIGEIDDDLPF